MEGVISNFLFTSGPSVVVIKAAKGQYLKQGRSRYGSCLLFAQRAWPPQSVERNRCHPDQGEDNPNRKGVAGNGRV